MYIYIYKNINMRVYTYIIIHICIYVWVYWYIFLCLCMYPRLYVPEEWSGCCILGREKNYICNALGDIAGKVHSFPEVRLCSILLGRNSRFRTPCVGLTRPQWQPVRGPRRCQAHGIQLRASFADLGEIWAQPKRVLTWKLGELHAVSALAFLRSQIFHLSGWQMC